MACRKNASTSNDLHKRTLNALLNCYAQEQAKHRREVKELKQDRDRWKHLSKLLFDEFSPLTEKIPIHPDDWHILRQVAEYEETVMISDLAANCDRSGLGRRLRELERRGLVRRPLGERKGYIITTLGNAMLASVDFNSV
jgi:hypothetical protein